MHRGRQYRAVIPYTSSANWVNDNHWANRIFIRGEVENDLGNLNFDFLLSDPYTNPVNICTYRYHLKVTDRGRVFLIDLSVSPAFSTPNNVVVFECRDLLGGSLIADYAALPGMGNPAAVIQDTDLILLKAQGSGNFASRPPVWQVAPCTYHEEP